jgi:hypothetical protein
VLVAEHEVHDYRPDDTGYVGVAPVSVGEVAQPLYPLGELPGRGRDVEHVAVLVADDHPDLVRLLEPAGRLGVVEGAVGDDPVQLVQQVDGDRLLA